MLKRFTGYKRLLALSALSGGAAPVERTATGNPLTFQTDLARPLKSLLIPFTPVQSGSGDPSPENIRPIVPWDGVNVWSGGKNITEILKNAPYGTYEGFGFKHILTFKVKPNTDYTLSSTSTGAINVLYFNGTNSQYVGVNASNPRTQNSGASGTLTVLLYDRENIADYENGTIKVQLEEGNVATPIDQYEGTTYPVSFPSPVYGGTLDVVSGVLTVTHELLVVDGVRNAWSVNESGDIVRFTATIVALGGEPPKAVNQTDSVFNYLKTSTSATDTWIGIVNQYGNVPIRIPISEEITTTQAWRAYLTEHPLQICYELATPQEITLTPEQITALLGDNTIWSDADGSMTAVYLVSAAYDDSHPVGGLGSGLLGGGLGSGTGEPDEPGEPDDNTGDDQPGDDQPEEP